MRKIRYAVVGLGYISQVAMLPAFRSAERNSELAAVVSGDPRKRRELSHKYGARIAIDYDGFDALVDSGDIEAVYIGLPNALHRRYVERAARAGVHILCDKPLAVTADDCREMVAAAERAKVKLMTAYRLHFEPANLTTLKAVHTGAIGEPRFFTSEFSMQVRAGNIRTSGELGGGSLLDLGVYCVNAARHVFQSEPIEVSAMTVMHHDERFADVEEMASVQLRFAPDRLATFTCSFGAADTSVFHVRGDRGSVTLEQAYEMVGAKTLHMEQRKRARLVKRTRPFPATDQFAPLLLHFSDCILHDRDPLCDGREGLADIAVVDAIKEAAARQKTVRLSAAEPPVRLSVRAARAIAPHGKPDLIAAREPSL